MTANTPEPEAGVSRRPARSITLVVRVWVDEEAQQLRLQVEDPHTRADVRLDWSSLLVLLGHSLSQAVESGVSEHR
jgi:hypothetical protein